MGNQSQCNGGRHKGAALCWACNEGESVFKPSLMVHTYVMEKELLQEKGSPGLLADYLIWRERGNLEWCEQGMGFGVGERQH